MFLPSCALNATSDGGLSESRPRSSLWVLSFRSGFRFVESVPRERGCSSPDLLLAI